MWNQIYNPETGRSVQLKSRIGKRVLSNYLKMVGGADIPRVKCRDRHTRESGEVCPPTRICNPRTGRCVNIGGVTGTRAANDWNELDRVQHDPAPAAAPAPVPPVAAPAPVPPAPAPAPAAVPVPVPAAANAPMVVPDGVDNLQAFIRDHDQLPIPILEEALRKANQYNAHARGQVPRNNQAIISTMRLTMSITQKLTAARQRLPPQQPHFDFQCTNPVDVISQERWDEMPVDQHKNLIIIEIYSIPNDIMPYHPSIPFDEYISQIQFQKIENACITKDDIRHMLTDTPIHPDDAPIVQAHQNGRKDQEPYSGYNGLRLHKYGLDSCIWVNRTNDSGNDGNCNMNEQRTQKLVEARLLPPEIWLQKIPAITHSNMYLTLQATKALYRTAMRDDNDDPIRFQLYKSQYRLPVGNSADSTHEGATKGNVEFNIYTDTIDEWHYMERISDLVLEHDIPTIQKKPIMLGDYIKTTFYDGDPKLYIGQVVDIDTENNDYFIIFTDPDLLKTIPGPHLSASGEIIPGGAWYGPLMWCIATDKRYTKNELVFAPRSTTPNINKYTLDILRFQHQPYTVQPIQFTENTSWHGTSEWLQRSG